MASSLGNLNMSDMKWIGEPLDVVGQYQKGVNLAEQGQRMQQSADMHPLKMDDAKARTNLVKQQGEYNTRTMDSRVGLSDSMARLKETAASIAENTQGAQEDIVQARSMQDMVNAKVAEATILSKTDATRSTNLMAVQRQERDLFTDAAQKKNTLAVADINHSNAYVAQKTQDNKIEMYGYQVGAAGREADIQKRNLDDYNTQLPNMRIELNAISNMSYADLKDYEIPSGISHATHRAEIERHRATRRGTDAHADYQREINQANNLDQQHKTRQLGVQNKLNATTRTILDIPGAIGVMYRFRNDSGTLNQAGEAMLDKLEASSAVYDKLSAANKEVIRQEMHSYRGMSQFPTGQGETLTGKYGADYNGQLILDAKGIAKANEMLVGQERAAELSQSKWAAQVLGLDPETMDAKGNITRKRGMPTRTDVLEAVTKEITSITERVVDEKSLTSETELTEEDLIKIRTEAFRNVDAGLIPRGTNAADILGVGAGGTYGTAGQALRRPVSTVAPSTGTPPTSSTSISGGTPAGPPAPSLAPGVLAVNQPPAHAWNNSKATGGNDDVMIGKGGYTPKEFDNAQAGNTSGDDAKMWKVRQEVFEESKAMLKGVGTHQQNVLDARYMTKLAIKSKYKTTRTLGLKGRWLRDDFDYDSHPSKLLEQVTDHVDESMNERLELMGFSAMHPNFAAQIMSNIGDATKWPKTKSGPSAKGYSSDKQAKIRDNIQHWHNWNQFRNRLGKANGNVPTKRPQ